MKLKEHRYIKVTIESSYEYIALVCSVLRQICDFAAISAKTQYEGELSLTEALANVIEHAYENRGEEEIEVQITIRAKEMEIKIFNFGKFPDERDISMDSKDVLDIEKVMNVGGLGLYIIRSYMDEVKFSRDEDKNTMMMKKYLVV